MAFLKAIGRRQQFLTSYKRLPNIVHIPARPYIGAAVAVVVGSTITLYALKAYQRMQAEELSNLTKRQTSDASEFAEDSSPQTAKMSSSYLGLDLGSTFSKIGHLDTTNKGVGAVLLQNAEGRRAVPCCVYRLPDGTFSVGQLARSARYMKPQSTAFSPALLLGKSLVQSADSECFAAVQKATARLPFKLSKGGISMEQQTVPISTLLELVAADMVKVVTDIGIKGDGNRGIPSVVMSYPSFFSVDACAALESSVSRAGMQTVDLIPDAVSAYIGALESGEKAPGREAALAGNTVSVAVLDVGGRLLQAGLLLVSHNPSAPSGLKVQLINERTSFDVGGEFVDEAIATHFASKFKDKHGVDLLIDPQAKQRIFDAAESAKIDLSRNKQTTVNIPYITATPKGTLHLDQTLTRAQLQSLLEDQESKAAKTLQALLFDTSNTSSAPLAGVLLAGGSSRMQFARAAVEKVTGMVPVETREPEALIATGAAAYAKYKH